MASSQSGVTPEQTDRTCPTVVSLPPARRGRAGALEPGDALEPGALRSEWARLAERGGSVFGTPEWVDAWWTHVGGGAERLDVPCWRADGSLGAVLPLAVTRRGPWRVVRIAGHGPADELGPVSAPEERAAAAHALRLLLQRSTGRWHAFIGDVMPARAPWTAMLGGATLRREASPVLRLAHDSWDAYLGSRSGHFRKRLRWSERRLAREGAVRYRTTSSPSELRRDFATLRGLHEIRWGAESDAFVPPRDDFHRDFAARALDRGWLRLTFLEVDGVPVAAWYGFVFAGAVAYYQLGWDPAWGRLSVGSLLVTRTIREALEAGYSEYRLLRGAEDYKERWATEDGGLETVGVGLGGLERTALATLALNTRLPPAVRARLAGPVRRARRGVATNLTLQRCRGARPPGTGGRAAGSRRT